MKLHGKFYSISTGGVYKALNVEQVNKNLIFQMLSGLKVQE